MDVPYYKGSPLGGARGPAGPDGNPVGSVITFMGTTAPADYLVCDGATYPITVYPSLAQFFADQFGEANHFGGDGTTTFAVPDMRNLFLRGYHGSSEEALSGEIGEKQDATEHTSMRTNDLGFAVGPKNTPLAENSIWTVNNSDATGPLHLARYIQLVNADAQEKMADFYTSRPVNMAVLYCIKAVSSTPVYGLSLDEYDTDDGWHVRKWSDGYVEMDLTRPYTVPVSDWEPWGSCSTVGIDAMSPVDYPLPLIEFYGEWVDCTSVAGYVISLMSGKKVTNKTRVYGLFRPTAPSNALNLVFYHHVTGRWK